MSCEPSRSCLLSPESKESFVEKGAHICLGTMIVGRTGRGHHGGQLEIDCEGSKEHI